MRRLCAALVFNGKINCIEVVSFNVALNINKPFTEYNVWSRVCLCGSSGVNSYIYIHTHTHTHTYICIFLHVIALCFLKT